MLEVELIYLPFNRLTIDAEGSCRVLARFVKVATIEFFLSIFLLLKASLLFVE